MTTMLHFVFIFRLSFPPLLITTQAMQLYQMPDTVQQTSPGLASAISESSPLFLVEFIRIKVEIFAFKKFYQWARQQVEELVKKDYAVESFIAGSPM
jgi:hypothetical protein